MTDEKFCFFVFFITHHACFFCFFVSPLFHHTHLFFFCFITRRNHLCAILKETLAFVVEIHTHTDTESESESQRERQTTRAACAWKLLLIKEEEEWVATRS